MNGSVRDFALILSMADSSKLPYELLHEIVIRLDTIEDLVYFSVVCRLWHHIASMAKPVFYPKTPWLLLAENTIDNPDCLRKVLNPFTNKCFQLKLPEITRFRCWGSAYGWIVTYNSEYELHLFNPLTKARMSLPHRSCLPYLIDPRREGLMDEEGALYFIIKAFVFEVTPDDFVVFVIYLRSSTKLAFARPGDQLWTNVEEPTLAAPSARGKVIIDVIVHDAKILILYQDASVGYLNMFDLNVPLKLTVNSYSPKYPHVLNDTRNLGLKAREYLPAIQGVNRDRALGTMYLVDSCGALFLVLRDMVNEHEGGDGIEDPDDLGEYSYWTTGFVVYELGADTRSWSQIHDIGDVALFVGNNSSMSVPARGADSRYSNCIYFTDDIRAEVWTYPSTGGNGMRVFKLKANEFDSVYDGPDGMSIEQTPLWFIPRF